MEGHVDQQRRRDDDEDALCAAVSLTLPGAQDLRHGDRREDRDDGIEQPELPAQEFPDEAQCPVPLRDAPELLGEGDPAVVGVPDKDRQEQGQGDDAAEPRPGRGDPPPRLRIEQKPCGDSEPEEKVGVLRRGAEPGKDADEQPEGRLARPAQPRQGPESERPEEHRGCIGGRGDHDAADQEGRIRPECRGGRDPPTELELAHGVEDGERQQQPGENGEQSDRQGRRAEQAGRAPIHQAIIGG